MDKKEISYEQKCVLLASLHRVSVYSWPKVFYELLYERWPCTLDYHHELTVEERRFLAERIQKGIGSKACMRYLNVDVCGMSDQMFDDLYDSSMEKYDLSRMERGRSDLQEGNLI